MAKKLGRPFAETIRIRKQVYLMPREADRLALLAEKEGLSESGLIEKILITSLSRRVKTV